MRWSRDLLYGELVLGFVLILVLGLLANLGNLHQYEQENSSIYRNRLRSLDFLLQADRDLYQASLALLEYLSGVGYSDSPVRDQLPEEVRANAHQAKERFDNFAVLFQDTDLPEAVLTETRAFQSAYSTWLRSVEIVLEEPNQELALQEYFQGALPYAFSSVRSILDKLATWHLDLSETDFQLAADTGGRLRNIYLVIVAIASIVFFVFLWQGVSLYRSQQARWKQSQEQMTKERISILNRVVQNLSHLVNTPAGNILTLVTFLEDRGSEASEEERRGSIGLIKDSAIRIIELMTSIRSLESEGRTGVQESVSIAALEQTIQSELMDLGVEISSWTVVGDKIVRFDTSALVEISRKLAENTKRFASAPRMQMNWVLDKRQVTLTFSNEGPAISKEMVAALFLPLQSSEGFSGRGLGLFLAENICRISLGGSLVLVENSDARVSFECRFPVEDA